VKNIPEWRQEIIKGFSHVWELNDKAHRENHFEAVFQCGTAISNRMDFGYDPKLILFAAYFHDMFAWSRVNHHELSYHWMMSTDHPVIIDNLNPSETVEVARGCLQHRASFKGNFKNQFCELINAADRMMPGNVSDMLERAILYRVAHHPEQSEDQRYEESVKHLKEKFGMSGYARYPEMYLTCFGEELQKQRDEIALL
jgi:hypothetical protein